MNGLASKQSVVLIQISKILGNSIESNDLLSSNTKSSKQDFIHFGRPNKPTNIVVQPKRIENSKKIIKVVNNESLKSIVSESFLENIENTKDQPNIHINTTTVANFTITASSKKANNVNYVNNANSTNNTTNNAISITPDNAQARFMTDFKSKFLELLKEENRKLSLENSKTNNNIKTEINKRSSKAQLDSTMKFKNDCMSTNSNTYVSKINTARTNNATSNDKNTAKTSLSNKTNIINSTNFTSTTNIDKDKAKISTTSESSYKKISNKGENIKLLNLNQTKLNQESDAFFRQRDLLSINKQLESKKKIEIPVKGFINTTMSFQANNVTNDKISTSFNTKDSKSIKKRLNTSCPEEILTTSDIKKEIKIQYTNYINSKQQNEDFLKQMAVNEKIKNNKDVILTETKDHKKINLIKFLKPFPQLKKDSKLMKTIPEKDRNGSKIIKNKTEVSSNNFVESSVTSKRNLEYNPILKKDGKLKFGGQDRENTNTNSNKTSNISPLNNTNFLSSQHSKHDTLNNQIITQFNTKNHVDQKALSDIIGNLKIEEFGPRLFIKKNDIKRNMIKENFLKKENKSKSMESRPDLMKDVSDITHLNTHSPNFRYRHQDYKNTIYYSEMKGAIPSDSIRVFEGPFDIRCISMNLPKIIKIELLKVLLNCNIFTKACQENHYKLKCYFASLEFEVEINKLIKLKDIFLVRFERISGSIDNYQDICDKILNNLKL